jgi:hypothetical protein
MRDAESYMWLGAGFLALYLYTDIKGFFGSKPQTTANTINQIQNAGGQTRTTELGTFWTIPGGSVSLTGQTFAPNLAQKLLIAADAFIPGDWLTRKVYGV